MTEAQEKKLNEVHEMLTNFTEIYDTKVAGKTVVFSDPNPNDEICPKTSELKK